MTLQEISSLLGKETAQSLLSHSCQKITRSEVVTPSIDAIKQTFRNSNRSLGVIQNLLKMYQHGRLGGTGYLSILPVDQGMEHTAGYSFADNHDYFDPETIIQTALKGGCSAVTAPAGVLGIVAKKYAQQLPLIVKLNHSEHLTLPEITDQVMFSSPEAARDMGAVGVGATIYFGSDSSHRQIREVSQAFEAAHRMGMFTVLWCYPRNLNYTTARSNHESAIDITAQAIHIGAAVGADIVKQKMPEPTYGFRALNFSKYNDTMYAKLLTKHPIDLIRYQVAHAYMGKIPLLSSGGESQGESDLQAAITAAIINKRGGGSGLIMGRKVFKRPVHEGVQLLHAVQDVYRNPAITVA